ncbi:hypothetical protein ACFLYO_05675 [Chloroflexota bacterium]
MRQSIKPRRDGLIILAAIISVSVYVLGAGMMGETGFPLDDAWIHQTYARNLAQSGQWAFVPGEPSGGSTAPLYTLFLSIGYFLRLPYLWWTTLLGMLTLAGAGLINARLAERLAPEIKSIGAWTGLATVLAWHLIWASASGMETMLFATLTLALIALAWRELDEPAQTVKSLLGRGTLLGLVGAATMLTRPEGVGLLGLIGLLMWIARPQNNWRSVLLWSVGVGLGWLVGFAPYALLNLNLGGSILPNTASAKQAEYAPLLTLNYLQRLRNMALPLLAGGQILLVPGIVATTGRAIQHIKRDRANILLLLPLVWGIALIALYAARLPATYQHGRYVIPALPHLILYGVVGTGLIIQWGRRSRSKRIIGQTLALTALILFVIFGGMGLQAYSQDVQIIQSEMVVSAKWLAANIPPEELLAVHDIGAVGYYAPRPILDLAGLVSPEVIPIIRQPDELWQLMQERDAQYLMAFPDQIPGGNPDDSRLCEVFSSNGSWSPAAGGANMAVYALAWDGDCP